MRLFRKTGCRSWTIELRDHNHKPQQVASGTRNRTVAQSLGARLQTIAEFRKASMPLDPKDLTWLATLPGKLVDRLITLDLVAGPLVAAQQPLTQHLDDYHQALVARGRSAGHAKQTKARIRAVIDGLGIERLGQLKAGRVESWLADQRANGMGTSTSNHYMAALTSFCHWLVIEDRATANPMAKLTRLPGAADRRQDRRALAADELEKLIATTATGPERHRIRGADRAWLYRIVSVTGLRAGEARQVVVSDFKLRDKPPTVTVRADYTKTKRERTIPLTPDVVGYLGERFKGMDLDGPALPIPAATLCAPMIRADLEAAGIPYVVDGKRFDFHALRHQFATALVKTGTSVKVAQQLLGHATAAMTMDVYAHANVDDAAAAIEKLG